MTDAAEPLTDDQPDANGAPAATDADAEVELVDDGHDADGDPLAAAEAERDGYLDDLRRVSAEFANFRKQVDKRNADVRAHAAAGLAEALLPVLDACDAAVTQGAADVEPIRAALLEALRREGLEVEDPSDDPFDPERHEAVLSEEGDGEAVVAEVLRTGYAWKGRVLRPAMVKVRG